MTTTLIVESDRFWRGYQWLGGKRIQIAAGATQVGWFFRWQNDHPVDKRHDFMVLAVKQCRLTTAVAGAAAFENSLCCLWFRQVLLLDGGCLFQYSADQLGRQGGVATVGFVHGWFRGRVLLLFFLPATAGVVQLALQGTTITFAVSAAGGLASMGVGMGR